MHVLDLCTERRGGEMESPPNCALCAALQPTWWRTPGSCCYRCCPATALTQCLHKSTCHATYGSLTRHAGGWPASMHHRVMAVPRTACTNEGMRDSKSRRTGAKKGALP